MQNDISFDTISNEILQNKKFHLLSYENHHGISRLDHVMRVSKLVYKTTKLLKLDYISATRAALLHDFFTDDDLCGISHYGRYITHPFVASALAQNELELNDMEINCIESHMFPANFTIPKYREAWILSIIDTAIAVPELFKNKYKYDCLRLVRIFKNQIQLASIILFYVMTMQHK